MNSNIKREDLEYLLDCYESGIMDEYKLNPSNESIKEKLKVIKDIRHRILVLSRGGFKIIQQEGENYDS